MSVLCFIVSSLPEIYWHPSNKSVRVNNDSTSVVFTCMANGALSYYWLKENGNIPSNAEGTDSNRLLLHNILPPDSGRYRCVAENDFGTRYSNYAMLIVEGTKLISRAICF